MCKSKFKIMRWLLGLMFLAVMVNTGQVANAGTLVGGTIDLNSDANLHVAPATALTGTFTIGPAFTGGTTSGVMDSAFIVMAPACGETLTVDVCSAAGVEAGVIAVSTTPGDTTSDSGCVDTTDHTATVTWTVTAGAVSGTYNFTPNHGIFFGSTAQCTVTFKFNVLALPPKDSRPLTGGIVDIDSSVGPFHVTGNDDSAGFGSGVNHSAFDLTCDVKVDKQVSCDGGQTWSDAADFEKANGDGTNGCIGTAGTAGVAGVSGVIFRYAAQNISDSGIGLLSCTIVDKDSTPSTVGGISTPFGIGNDGVNGGASTTSSGFSLDGEPATPKECMAGNPGNEPNTATVSCTCDIPALLSDQGDNRPVVTATDSATFGCCGVAVDKQVSCDGTNFTDTGFNDNNTGQCSGTIGVAAAIRYQFKNTGNLTLTCNGTASDTTPLGLIDVFAGPSCTTDADCPAPSTGCDTAINKCKDLNLTDVDLHLLSAGATSDFSSNPNITQCSSNLNTLEASGNTASVLCECTGNFANTVHQQVTNSDTAQLLCAGPNGFTVSKTCVAPGKSCSTDTDCPATYSCVTGQCSNTTFVSDVRVTNGGDNSLNCSVVDQTVSTNPNGSVACPVTGGVGVSMLPVSLAVNGGSGQTGDFVGTLSPTATVYNEACVTCAQAAIPCTGAGQGTCPSLDNMTATCVSSVCNYAPTTAAQATCPVGTCFTRTPGYWGTHPDQTKTVIGTGLAVCNDTMTNTSADTVHSATENLCENDLDASTGKGKDKVSYTSPQQLQLIRQCTSAALNLAASGAVGTNFDLTAGESACAGAVSGQDIVSTFNNCCVGPTSVCSSGKNGQQIAATSCLTVLGAFNALESGDFSQIGLVNTNAEPTQCNLANGNGDTNCQQDTLGGNINCGPK